MFIYNNNIYNFNQGGQKYAFSKVSLVELTLSVKGNNWAFVTNVMKVKNSSRQNFMQMGIYSKKTNEQMYKKL